MQKHFYLPEPQTDFIFAIFLEEFGLIGGVLLVGMYGYMFVTVFNQATKVKDLFGSFLMIGIISMIGIQTLINLGVVVGLFPVTGVTLPLMSYGRIVIDDYAYCNWNCIKYFKINILMLY